MGNYNTRDDCINLYVGAGCSVADERRPVSMDRPYELPLHTSGHSEVTAVSEKAVKLNSMFLSTKTNMVGTVEPHITQCTLVQILHVLCV